MSEEDDDSAIQLIFTRDDDGTRRMNIELSEKEIKRKAAVELLRHSMPYRPENLQVDKMQVTGQGDLQITGRICERDPLGHEKRPRIFSNVYSKHDFEEIQRRVRASEQDPNTIYGES